MTASVRTVLGDVAPNRLGRCDAHDHLFFRSAVLAGQELEDPTLAEHEAESLVRAGGSTLVQWTPLGCGRREDALAQLARRTDLQIVAATGLHQARHYDDQGALEQLVRSDLAAVFVAELTSGMRTGGLPGSASVDARAGVIKVGGQYHHLGDYERTVFAAAAEAHRATGAPVCVHTELGTHAHDILELLGERSVPPDRVILGHLTRNPDLALHAEVAQTGAFLAYDGPSIGNHATDWRLFDLLAGMAERGYAGQLLLGGDTTTKAATRAAGGGPGMAGLLTDTRDRIVGRIGDDIAQLIFETNPARAFAADWESTGG